MTVSDCGQAPDLSFLCILATVFSGTTFSAARRAVTVTTHEAVVCFYLNHHCDPHQSNHGVVADWPILVPGGNRTLVVRMKSGWRSYIAPLRCATIV